MRSPKGTKTHDVCPSAWKQIPNQVGDYDLDATIMHRSNTDLPHRLDQHIRKWAYRIRNDYNGYEGMD